MLKLAQDRDNNKYVESFLLSAQILESIVIPEHISKLVKLLKLSEVENKFTGLPLEKSALIYLALSHDIEMYLKVEEFRHLRNRLVHKLTSFEKLSELDKFSNDAISLFGKIMAMSQERDKKYLSYPVFNLYSEGYEEFRKQVLKILKDQIDSNTNKEYQ